ncbi:MAG TPA: hypothetical protein VFS02_10175 [Telluria sp.]|nr:hypothetical protein [Telluria sp.]
MNTCIYDKTEKGREEIATRKYHVAAKLRTLLVMIDGRQPLGSLMKNLGPLGLSEEHVDLLLGEDYIVLVGGGPVQEAAEPAAQRARAPVSARARMLARNAARQERMQSAERDEQPDVADEAIRFRALCAFYNETIKATLGLPGLPLQLKVEKAAVLGDLRALRLPFLQAALKAKGGDAALALRERLDDLLGGAPEVDDFTLRQAGAASPRRALDYFNLASDAVNF